MIKLGNVPLYGEDRVHHLYILGKGFMPDELLLDLAGQDIQAGEGICFISTKGNGNKLLNIIPKSLTNQTIYWNPSETKHPFGWNLLESVLPDERPRLAAQITEVFGSVWRNFWGPQSEQLLKQGCLSQLSLGQGSILGVYAMLLSEHYRKSIIPKLKDQFNRAYWQKFDSWDVKKQKDASAPLENKLENFLVHPWVDPHKGTKTAIGFDSRF